MVFIRRNKNAIEVEYNSMNHKPLIFFFRVPGTATFPRDPYNFYHRYFAERTASIAPQRTLCSRSLVNSEEEATKASCIIKDAKANNLLTFSLVYC